VAVPALDSPRWQTSLGSFLVGVQQAFFTVLAYVLFFTFVGIGALAHDSGFTVLWAVAGTILIWAGPAQIILIASAHAGATVLESALAVTISAMRLLPMVVGVLPMLRMPDTKLRQLALPAHMIAVTAWVESVRLLPDVPRHRRILFVNGLGTGLITLSCVATTVGFGLAASLPPLLAAGILGLTPLTFLFSTERNSTKLVDRVALGLGLVLYPLTSRLLHNGFDMLLSGLAAGTLAYLVHRMRRRAQ
jgi:predicted branched-subunit amino acid permease